MSRKIKSKRSNKRTQKKSLKRKTIRKRGGGCGCSDRITGGSLGLDRGSSEFFYPKNDEINKPNTPRDFINSERLMGDFSSPKFVGGKKKRTMKKYE